MDQVPGKYCIACSEVIDARSEVCPYCGAGQALPPQPPERYYPPQQIVPQQQYPQQYQPPPQQITAYYYQGGGKSRLVAIILALFLGSIGAHKFYLNQIGMGCAYLLFSCTCIPAFISIFEAIMYLLMTDGEFNRNYADWGR